MDQTNQKYAALLQRFNMLESENKKISAHHKQELNDLQIGYDKLLYSNNLQKKLNHFTSLIDNVPLKEIRTFILQQAREIFGVKYTIFNEFDEDRFEMVVSEVLIPNSAINYINKIAGIDPIGYRTAYSKELYNFVINQKTEKLDTLSELTLGKVPVSVSTMIQKFFGLGWFQPLALVSNAKLFGLLVLVGQNDQADLPIDELLAFSNISANAIKRKQAEEQVLLQESKLKAIISVLPDMLFVMDRNGYYKDFFARHHSDYNFDIGELGNAHISAMFSEEDCKTILALFEKCLCIGSLEVFEYPLEVNQKINYFEARITPINKTDLLLIVRNITKTKETKKALKESLTKIQAMMEHTNEYVWAWSTNNMGIYTNSKFKELLKILFNIEFQEDKNIIEQMPAGLKKLWLARIEKVLKKGHQVYEDQFTINQNIHFFETSINPIKLEDEIIGLTFIAKDITEKKNNLSHEKELELARHTTNLKRNFLANVSHEMRTPLTGILGMADILQTTGLNEVQKEYLNILTKSGENMQLVVDTMIDYANIELKKIELNHEFFSLKDLVNKSLSRVSFLSKKNLHFVAQFQDGLPETILTDKNRLSQIINNLLNNAEKFTQKGNITIKVGKEDNTKIQDNGLAPRKANTIIYRIEVIDTGSGISQEQQKLLFEPFYDFEKHYSRQMDGTGLGLSVCKGLTQLLGGVIGVVSEPAKGSKFWFTFQAELPD